MQRRQFLHGAAAGVLVSAPAFLQGCGLGGQALLREPVPNDPFLDWFAIDRDITARILRVAGAGGVDHAELFLQHRRRSLLDMQGGVISAARTDILQGASVRVMRGDDVGFASTEALDEASLMAAAGRASSSTAETSSFAGPLSAAPAGTLYQTNLPWSEVNAGQKIRLLEAVDRRVRDADATVSDVRLAWSDTDERVLIALLDGQMVADERPMTRLSVQVTMTRDGVSHSGFANIAARDDLSWYSEERISELVATAVSRTDILFAARRPPVGEMPVVLAAGSCGVVLHEAIGHSLEADFVSSGESPYGQSLNQRIADPAITIIDDATLPHERGAMNYDDEGLAGQANVLVENGMLRQLLHDRTTARQFSTRSTASGRRESFHHSPMPRMSCTVIRDGQQEADELLATMGRGIVVETIVGGQVSLGDGRFRFRVKHGFLVEKGSVLMPVRDFDIVGNGPDTLANISGVADDGRLDSGGWSCGKRGQSVPVSQGMPTVLVSSLGHRASVLRVDAIRDSQQPAHAGPAVGSGQMRELASVTSEFFQLAS